MFKIFKKKTEAEIIDEIHNEFDTAPERLLKEALKIINDETNDKISLESSIEEKAIRLEKLGFVKNALVARKNDIYVRNNKKNEIIDLTTKEAKIIKYYKDKYPFIKTITINELDRISEKYGLIYAPVQNYKFPVPDKNLTEIENAQPLNKTDITSNKFMLRISLSSQWNYDMPNQLKKILDNGFYIGESETDLISRDKFIMNLVKKYTEYQGNYDGWLTNAGGEINIIEENLQTLFICAPKKHFVLNGLKFDKKKGYFNFTKTVVKTDPIVFRYVKGNMVQILSKWGLEANDPALQHEILN